MQLPERIRLANLPTPIEKLERSLQLLKRGDVNVYIKRDDMTSSEASGNKLRKLEYTVAKALAEGAKTLVTCGAVQSNHCRATAVVAAKLGLGCHLVLSHSGMGPEEGQTESFKQNAGVEINGNYLTDLLMGAKCTFINGGDYSSNRDEIMEKIKAGYDAKGEKAFLIPEGASDGIGVFGYLDAYYEIEAQEKQMGLKFDTIAVATGSAGTIAGLYAGSEITGACKSVVGITVSPKSEDFSKNVIKLIEEAGKYVDLPAVNDRNLHIINGYYGRGYAIAGREEAEFIHAFASREGILLDTVYTAKAMRGLFSEIDKGNPCIGKNILFIHTGGQYGLFPQRGVITDYLFGVNN